VQIVIKTYQKYHTPYTVPNYVGNAGWILEDKGGEKKMKRNELIGRLNSLRHELESMEDDDGWNLETVEACLFYFIDHEDADPHWE